MKTRRHLATITWEWIVVPLSSGQYKFKGICRDSVPLHLPNQWLWKKFEDGSPTTALNYGYGLLRFYRWMEDNTLRIEDIARRHLYEFRSALNNGFGTHGASSEPLSSATRRQTVETVLQYLAWAMELENDEPFLGSTTTKRYRISRARLRIRSSVQFRPFVSRPSGPETESPHRGPLWMREQSGDRFTETTTDVVRGRDFCIKRSL